MNILDKRATNPAAALDGTELVYVAQLGDDAVTTVQDIQDFATNGFLLITTAAATYQTLSGMSSYLTVAAASSTYQTQAGMSAYLTTSAAASTYATTSSLTSGLLANLTPTINTQTGTSYTLQTADNDGKSYVRMTNASANTVTITTSLTKPVSISQRGAGTTTLVADTGVTLNGTLAFTAQHQTKTVIPIGSGVFDVVG
jgi:hypothetical protein